MVAPSEAVHRLLVWTYAYAPEKVSTISNGWGGAGVAHPGRANVPKIRSRCVSPTSGRRRTTISYSMPSPWFERSYRGRGWCSSVADPASAVRERVRTLGLETAVDFTGYVDDVWPFLARSRLFALASSYEPQGMAVLEAMAAGLPVSRPPWVACVRASRRD